MDGLNIGWEAHDGMVDGYFFNPYRNEMQHGIIIFENLEVGTDPEATFYQGVY